MSRRAAMDIIEKALFDDTIPLSGADQELKKRLQDVYSYWMSHPTLSDSKIVKYIQAQYKISRVQAYHDISRVKSLLGNISIASRSWMQNKVNIILDEAANAARNGDQQKAKVLAKIADSFIANNRLDTEEAIQLPYDEIVIGDLSFTVDPEVVGIKRVAGIVEKSKKLQKKYMEDVDIDEATISK